MGRNDLITRQWEILIRLSRGPTTRKSLQDEWHVSRETIKRDMDVLSLLFPITEERCGNEITYSFVDDYDFPGVWFTPEEMASLLLGKEIILQALEGLPHQDAFRSLLQKVESMQKGTTMRTMRELPEVFRSDFSPPERHNHFQEQLVEAALDQRKVKINYFSAHSQKESERVIEPYVLRLSVHGLHLIAYCHKRKDIIFFNINRIKALVVLDDTFDLEKMSFDLKRYLEESFGGLRSHPIHEVKLFIKKPTSDWAKELVYHPTQQIHETKEGIELSFRAGGMNAIVRQVVSLGPDCEVRSPDILREEVKTYLKETLANYSPSSSD